MVAIDNDYFASNATPPLTTIDQHEGDVGRTMAEMLLRLIAGDDVPRVTMMPTSVVRRGSE